MSVAHLGTQSQHHRRLQASLKKGAKIAVHRYHTSEQTRQNRFESGILERHSLAAEVVAYRLGSVRQVLYSVPSQAICPRWLSLFAGDLMGCLLWKLRAKLGLLKEPDLTVISQSVSCPGRTLPCRSRLRSIARQKPLLSLADVLFLCY